MPEYHYAAIKLDEIAKQRDIAYEMLSKFAEKRTAWYRDTRSVNLDKLLSKDVVMFAARGITTASAFVEESFRACESSSEETVMGNTWQSIIAGISSDTLDTGDMMTVRDGAIYVCELKSQTNTTNSSSFPQELRELKDKCEAQKRFKRASGQDVLPAFCVLRNKKPIDEWRTFDPDPRDLPNQDIRGFRYRYLAGPAFWQWLTGFDSVEGLVDDLSRIELGEIREARMECLTRLHAEMQIALEDNKLGSSISDVLKLKRILHG
ncbi:PmeII family type II restriction endonuclease [uncultured Senegalimassilia sp.]|uniref:PmeII family type II restriction endonuclease n=1 Tax=uncultured Senegalimassilia sp. TaxID=1714350 RepID=UPI0026DF6401|nr:PmeII family type II restriction endonuclease [uncultured Senegalimassilia sp.]